MAEETPNLRRTERMRITEKDCPTPELVRRHQDCLSSGLARASYAVNGELLRRARKEANQLENAND
jgi:hypothetical protein